MRCIITALAVLFLSSCGGNTIQKLRDGLSVAAKVAKPAQKLVNSDAFCRPVLEWCKIAKKNPCPPLDECIQVRKEILEAFPKLGAAMMEINERLKLYEQLQGVKNAN